MDPNKNFEPYENITWCHGASGIGMTRLGMQKLYQDDYFEHEIHVAVDRTTQDPFKTLCLCHGDLGNHDFLLETHLRNKSAKFQETYLNYTENLMSRIQKFSDDFQFPGTFSLPGLMMGRAGVAYQMMRLAHPKMVPSILLMSKQCAD